MQIWVNNEAYNDAHNASLCHLANIACRTNRALKFDPEKEQIVGDEESNKLVRRQYREGHWAVPKRV